MARNLLLLILLCCPLLYAKGQFSFSARITAQNQQVFFQQFYLSPLMQHKEKSTTRLCQFEATKPYHVSPHAFLLEHQDKLLECFIGQGVRIHDKAELTLKQGLAYTDMHVPPVRFTVEFKDDFVTLFLLAP